MDEQFQSQCHIPTSGHDRVATNHFGLSPNEQDPHAAQSHSQNGIGQGMYGAEPDGFGSSVPDFSCGVDLPNGAAWGQPPWNQVSFNREWPATQPAALFSQATWNELSQPPAGAFDMNQTHGQVDQPTEDISDPFHNVHSLHLDNPTITLIGSGGSGMVDYPMSISPSAQGGNVNSVVGSLFEGLDDHSCASSTIALYPNSGLDGKLANTDFASNSTFWEAELDFSAPQISQLPLDDSVSFNEPLIYNASAPPYGTPLDFESFSREGSDSFVSDTTVDSKDLAIAQIAKAFPPPIFFQRPPAAKPSKNGPRTNGVKAPFTMESRIIKFHTATPRQKYSKDRRKEVAATRNIGACFRCRTWKVPCLPNPKTGVCERCSTGADPSQHLCFRLDLSDCEFYRTRSALHSDAGPVRQKMDWLTSQDVTIRVNVATVPGAPPIFINCRRFKPAESDMVIDLVRGESAGAVVKFPSYAAVDLRAVEEQIQSHAREFGKQFLSFMEHGGSYELVLRILRGAFAHADQYPKGMVSVALDIWACSRMCALDRSLEGEETLGQAKITDPLSPIYNQIPIPKMLDHQCDTATIKWMGTLANDLIKRLWQAIRDKKRSNWLEVFLTIFILVNNVEFVYGVQKEMIYQYENAEEIAPQVRRRSTAWMEQWSWSAKHLLFIYQTYFKKRYPFTDPALVDEAKSLYEDTPTQSLLAYLLQLSVPESYEDNGAKEAGDFNYETVWTRELFKTEF